MENAEWAYCREIYDGDCTGCETVKTTEDILDFANMVFSMAYSSTDFAALLPKAYSRERCGLPVHHMILEENKIRALIDSYPVNLHLRGEGSTLKAVYVGTVSVHPGSRGRGYMIELMRRVEEDARRQGCALMLLDGERHRYQHYGFERAGIQYVFEIETGNIRHCCAGMYGRGSMEKTLFHFEELTEDSSYLDQIYELYRQRLVTARSREDFWLCVRSYNASVYAVLRDGRVAGYVNLSENGERVLEFASADNGDICRVLYDLMMEFGVEQLQVSVGMDEPDRIAELEKACDSCRISMSHQIKILDYEAVLGFLLRWKQGYGTLAISDYVLGVQDEQTGIVERYLLSVAKDGISVSRTEDTPGTVLEKLELVRILTTGMYFAEQQKGMLNKVKNAPAGWFPLPFYLPEADTF